MFGPVSARASASESTKLIFLPERDRVMRQWARWGVSALAGATVLACTDHAAPDLEMQNAAPQIEPMVTNLSFAQISAGSSHSCGRTMTDGRLYCWGANNYGQLGNTTRNNKKRPTPVTSTLQFRWVSAGPAHTCAIAVDGKAYCWGANSAGQLGDGTITERWSPILVLGSLSWKQIEVGGEGTNDGFTCGLTTGGSIYCWGWNGDGELGNGSSGGSVLTRFPTPATDVGVTYRQVTTGGHHACAVSTTNVAYCWGQGGHGQTGNGGNYSVPTAVSGGLAFRQVSAGQYHTCGTTTRNKAYCWGDGFFGELGNGTNTNDPTPRPVSGGQSYTRVFASAYHTCALTTGHAAWCWGSNANGQLGDGTKTDRLTPVAVKGGLLFAQLSSRVYHTCAVTASTGVGYCWGNNAVGQVGDGTTSSPRRIPTLVAGAL